jgi:hypothetical protein
VDWQLIRGRSVTVVQEERSIQGNAYDLQLGVKVNLFECSLGLSAMNVEATRDGRLRGDGPLGIGNSGA